MNAAQDRPEPTPAPHVPKVLDLSAEETLVRLAGQALSLASKHNRRVLIGLAGGPGSGKSTLAEALAGTLNELVPGSTAVMGMDGFHRTHKELEAAGDVADKGAPHTFRAAAFVSQLQKLKTSKEDVSCPIYSREIEDVVPDAQTIEGKTPIVLIEGNYLLLGDAPWNGVKPLLDLAVHLSVPRDVVMKRLISRHAEHGLFDEAHIHRHVDKVDLPNYDLIEKYKDRADLIIRITDAT